MATDPELLAAWRDGNAQAGQELFARYFAPISRFFANKLSEDHDDLVQETFMACVRGRDRLANDASFRSYLFGVACNVLRAYYRRKRKADQVDEIGESSIHELSPGPSTIMGSVQQEQLLLDALRRLTMDQQVVLEMSYWEEMSSVEIGAALGISDVTARTRLHRAREQLRQVLAQLPASQATRDAVIAEQDAWVARIRASMQFRPT